MATYLQDFRRLLLGIACAAPLLFAPETAVAAPSEHPVYLDWLSLRGSAQVVQNSTGNAFSLLAGWSPRLHVLGFPLGLRFLGEFGALRTTSKKLFFVPSTQLLLDWAVAPRLEIAAGGGVQFWQGPAAHNVRAMATLEAHYVPPHKFWKVFRSAFVASSIAASSRAGLQVRAGFELDFGPQRPDPWQRAASAAPQACVAAACPPVVVCPPCVTPLAEVSEQPPQDLTLHTHLMFAFNRWSLSEEAKRYLHALGSELAKQPGAWVSLAIIGHADSIGTEAQNQEVSEHRAHAVEEALVASAVPLQKLQAQGVGETELLPGMSSHAAQQRRVVLRLHGVRLNEALKRVLDMPLSHPKEATP